MRVHKSIVLIIMFFLLILLILHLSSWRHISFDDKEDIMEERRRRMKFPFPFPQAYEEFKDKRVSGFQIVSHTSTPGGPNPLHN
ncbi:unnamed protein product [Trifolium pratense]|uniref:Uncharacterized protein n=1 Tax=Trifolium pratense TaxID=57577 RepID=A0ACB0LB25_TRIPR|nr:unnamed protein product [Trifolium pratense]